MDGAATASVQLAEALAATAATFQMPSRSVAEHFPDHATRAELAAALPFAILAAPGGSPILERDSVVGGLGIAGPPPRLCEQLAASVLGAGAGAGALEG
jgi:uncharacterized protein GlcG (DUF336 family)